MISQKNAEMWRRSRMVADMTGACARQTPQALWERAPSVGMHVYHGNTSLSHMEPAVEKIRNTKFQIYLKHRSNPEQAARAAVASSKSHSRALEARYHASNCLKRYLLDSYPQS